MSKLAPRNATVEFVDDGDRGPYVRKRYHAVYTAEQERDAYALVAPVYEAAEGIRCARVLGLEDETLELEFVPGDSLYERAARGDVEPLERWMDRLVYLFAEARNTGVSFDSDPSNFIEHDGTGELIAVDPVCPELGLRDHTAVVFLWGIMKLALRTVRFWRYRRLVGIATTFWARYLDRSAVDEQDFRDQLCDYIDIVIGWNREISDRDSRLMIAVRRFIAIPLYSTARFAIRRGYPGPRRRGT